MQKKVTPELSILQILSLSLALGLLAGTGAGKDAIIPVTCLAAAIFYVNRRKIAAQDATAQPRSSSQQNILSPKGYFVWPALGQFAFAMAGKSYQGAIQKLAQENKIDFDVDTDLKAHILKAHLIPDNDNPYDSSAVRVDINNRTVGQLNREQAHSFRRRLNEKGLSDQITICNAIITRSNEESDKTLSYDVRLDIEPFE